MTDQLSRRTFLRFVGKGSVLLLGGGLLNACSTWAVSTPVPRLDELSAVSPEADSRSEPDIEMTLKAAQAAVSVFPGHPTTVWRYEATVTRGDPDSVWTLPDSYIGPIIRVRRGQRLRITFVNDLPDPDQVSIVHWHGLHLPEDMDAHPRYVVRPGETYLYDFTVADRAGTYWFHPHPHTRTGRQVYMGLAGLFIVTDDEGSAAALPTGDQDVPLVIQDRTFDQSNQLVYLDSGMGGMRGMDNMMANVMGFLGQQILVNGKPDFALNAATRAYRLRLLNGSNSRIYKLAWSDGTPLTVIGTDGGLLERPVQRPYVMLRRASVWSCGPIGAGARWGRRSRSRAWLSKAPRPPECWG
ncbi:MAG: multicopper oxidase family protein [Anaerolineae bacterium]